MAYPSVRPRPSTGKIKLLMRRFLRARALGVAFPGTSRFRMPKSLRLCNRLSPVSVPDESGHDKVFIYLALDDAFGLRELPFQPKTILDIGANFGLFSLLAAHYCRPTIIHAYEPNPRIFSHTVANLALVGGIAFQEGVGSCSGLAVMCDQGESRLAQTVRSEAGTVRIVSLIEAINRIGSSVDLLKLNCEGAEWEILAEAQPFQKVGLIRMEYHLIGGWQLDHLVAFAKHLGFRIDRLIPRQDSGYAWLSRAD
jgi:FkbM family methyltransferase